MAQIVFPKSLVPSHFLADVVLYHQVNEIDTHLVVFTSFDEVPVFCDEVSPQITEVVKNGQVNAVERLVRRDRWVT